MNSPHDLEKSENTPALLVIKPENVEKPEGNATAWRTIAGGYVSILHICVSADGFYQGGWQFSQPLDTFHHSEYTRICMSCLGRRLLPTLAGLVRCKYGASLPWRFPQEASLIEDISNMLFLGAPSFTS
jgi:hypothetical protein